MKQFFRKKHKLVKAIVDYQIVLLIFRCIQILGFIVSAFHECTMFTNWTPLIVSPLETIPATVSKLWNNKTENKATSENQHENNQKYLLLVKLDGKTNSGYRV